MSAAVTVLAVSAGAATAEQLARVAASAADNGRDIAGILVANPDPSDQTTGRLPQLARPGTVQNAHAHDRQRDGDQKVTEKDQTVISPLVGSDDMPDRLDSFSDFADAVDPPADFTIRLVSLAFIRAALRRSAWLWRLLAVAGLLIGIGVYVAAPPAYKASTSILLTYGPLEDASNAVLDNQAVVQSRAVAQLAEEKLGLHQDPGSFLAAYNTAVLTNRVLLITVSAPSSHDAVTRASAIATAFLQFRTDQLETTQTLLLGNLSQQIGQTSQQISSISNQISQVSAEPSSPSQRAQLNDLRTNRTQAAGELIDLQQSLINHQTSVEPGHGGGGEGQRCPGRCHPDGAFAD